MRRIAKFRYTWRTIAHKYSYLCDTLAEDGIAKTKLSTVIENMPKPEKPHHNSEVSIGSFQKAKSEGFLAQDSSTINR